MTNCAHANRRCLNHYDKFRKYHCPDCGQTFICECERDLVLTLFPHQSHTGREAGTAAIFKVNGFANVCAICRGEKEEAHPRAQIYGQKKKLDRYYWREIDRSYYEKILDFLNEKGATVKDIFEFEQKYPSVTTQFRKEARIFWLQKHKEAPLYSYIEQSEDDFLKKVPVPTTTLSVPYVNRDGRGLWVTKSGGELSAEAFVADYYIQQGYQVHRCERRIISTLIAAFLWTPLNTPDVKLEICGIGSRGKFSKTPTSDFDRHGFLWFHRPKDFGTKEFFSRKRKEFNEWLNLLRRAGTLLEQFNYCLEVSYRLRDYLWVNNDEAEAVTRAFLKTVPDKVTFKVIKWAIGDFWNRQPGWPDLFMVKGSEYLFVEVKGHNDRLSPDQMNWFEMMVKAHLLNCCLIRLEKSTKNHFPAKMEPGY